MHISWLNITFFTTLSLNQALATESTDYLADDTMSQYKTNYRAEAWKTAVNMFQKYQVYIFPGKKARQP